jgi:hypothetical protein
MKDHLKLGGAVVMAGTVAVALGAALWPHAFTEAAFGIDVAPLPAETVDPGAWVATALVRVAGVLVAAFAAMIFGTLAPRRTGRWIFGSVGVVAMAVAIGQWIAILPFAVGLGVTALSLSLVTLGYVALWSLESQREGGA